MLASSTPVRRVTIPAWPTSAGCRGRPTAFGNALGQGIVDQMQSPSSSAPEGTKTLGGLRQLSTTPAEQLPVGGGRVDVPELEDGVSLPMVKNADGSITIDGKTRRPSVTANDLTNAGPALSFAADTAARRGAGAMQAALARASVGGATAEDLKILGQFPSNQRIDSSLAAIGPSALAKTDGSPATYSFNERTGQAYWDLGEGNTLREIPKAFKQPTLRDAAFADPNNPFTQGPRLGTVLRDFAIYSGLGSAVIPASLPVSGGYFGIGAVAGGVVNYSFQSATGPEVKVGDVVNATITGGLTFGKGIVPSLLVNSFGAFTTASIQGDDATVKTLAAAGGTLLGAPVGQAAQSLVRNGVVALTIRNETPVLSSAFANTILPANGVAASTVQESVGAGTDWLNAQARKPK